MLVMKTFLSLSISVCLVLLLSQSSFGFRKGSVFGKMVDSVKQGATAVKNDINDYNTFVVSLDVKNRSHKNYMVEIYNKRIENHPRTVSLMPVFSENIAPGGNLRESLEIKAYVSQRSYTFIVFDNESSDSIFFDPSKRDKISYTIN